MPGHTVSVAGKRGLYIAIALTAITIWALARFNPHSGLGPFTPVVVPVLVFFKFFPTENWPPILTWPLITVLVFAWVWLWAFAACLLALRFSARASNNRLHADARKNARAGEAER